MDTPQQTTLHRKLNLTGANPATDLPKWVISVANCLSTAFSPLLVPSFCMAITMWVTPLSALPEKTRFLSTLMVMFITGGIPFAAIAMMMRMGFVSDLAISNRRQRTIPLCIAVLCYIGAIVYIACLHAPVWLMLMIAGAAISCVVTLLISFKWKISGHATGMGGMVGMLAWLFIHGLYTFNLLPWIVAAIIIAGMVGSARIILGHHTQSQIYAGFCVGVACIYGTMSLNNVIIRLILNNL